jgi:hypothetical protein
MTDPTSNPGAAWQALIDRLEQRRRVVHEQISCYPTPIPACDADFNALLAERDCICADLNRARELAARGAAPADFAPSTPPPGRHPAHS